MKIKNNQNISNNQNTIIKGTNKSLHQKYFTIKENEELYCMVDERNGWYYIGKTKTCVDGKNKRYLIGFRNYVNKINNVNYELQNSLYIYASCFKDISMDIKKYVCEKYEYMYGYFGRYDLIDLNVDDIVTYIQSNYTDMNILNYNGELEYYHNYIEMKRITKANNTSIKLFLEPVMRLEETERDRKFKDLKARAKQVGLQLNGESGKCE